MELAYRGQLFHKSMKNWIVPAMKICIFKLKVQQILTL